jgi:hypothetical protein
MDALLYSNCIPCYELKHTNLHADVIEDSLIIHNCCNLEATKIPFKNDWINDHKCRQLIVV